ncbi:hypothetical protein BKA62DRAFT_723627 [Auriculariales sp. MPI-PUGE-AT-0066]|nr:hypothetical protein BKA62DRAFT_723627 [Auriculariales sp. MPI-PUGE-AT-0066]
MLSMALVAVTAVTIYAAPHAEIEPPSRVCGGPTDEDGLNSESGDWRRREVDDTYVDFGERYTKETAEAEKWPWERRGGHDTEADDSEFASIVERGAEEDVEVDDSPWGRQGEYDAEAGGVEWLRSGVTDVEVEL